MHKGGIERSIGMARGMVGDGVGQRYEGGNGGIERGEQWKEEGLADGGGTVSESSQAFCRAFWRGCVESKLVGSVALFSFFMEV